MSAPSPIDRWAKRLGLTRKPVLAITTGLLLFHGYCLYHACAQISFRQIEHALREGDDPQALALINRNPWLASDKSDDGEDLLFLISQINGCHECARRLIELGTDINARTGDGQTPLFSAASGCNRELVTILIDLGADVQARNSLGENPLHYLIWGGSLGWYEATRQDECVATARILIEAGCAPVARDRFFQTPLDIARTRRIQPFINLLAKYSLDPLAPTPDDFYGPRPLMPQMRNFFLPPDQGTESQ